MKSTFKFIVVLFFMFYFLSCDENENIVNDDQNVNDEQMTEDELSDGDALQMDGALNQDTENTNDDVLTDNEQTDSIIGNDDEVESDSEIENDSELLDGDTEAGDESSDGMESPDEDRVKPDPVDCPEGLVGLTIRVSYSNGSENIDGGGTVVRNPSGTATEDLKTTCYAPNTDVALTVVPDATFTFSAWKGKGGQAVSGTFPDFSIKVVNPVTLRAEFVKQ